MSAYKDGYQDNANSVAIATGGVKDTVDRIVRGHAAVVFSRPGCPYCLGARNICRKYMKRTIKPEEVCFVDVEGQTDARAYRNYLKLVTGNSVLPAVFVQGSYIGGLEQLTALHRDDRLAEMLRTATQNDPFSGIPSGKTAK
ncbi:GLRX1-like protein [Mya arenaria]|uniref:GLRX1-like protein n=1 Tax=Mya arenaria TaxID=6604 RepID=A0ABY7DMF4_MYAAR|nr:uncharacterized protein LOC128225579 [Mya arenaria]WAQ98343.1 GLRX1-like protein [Mya arenaria]